MSFSSPHAQAPPSRNQQVMVPLNPPSTASLQRHYHILTQFNFLNPGGPNTRSGVLVVPRQNPNLQDLHQAVMIAFQDNAFGIKDEILGQGYGISQATGTSFSVRWAAGVNLGMPDTMILSDGDVVNAVTAIARRGHQDVLNVYCQLQWL